MAAHEETLELLSFVELFASMLFQLGSTFQQHRTAGMAGIGAT